MKVIIDPAWSLERTIEASHDAYIGGGQNSRGYRMSVLMVWANIVGRQRAVDELEALRNRFGGWGKLADELGVGASTLRKVRRHFGSVPDHLVSPNSLPRGGEELTLLTDFSHLGSGGYGEVWRAKDTLGRNVAVKYIISPTTEAQRTAIDHASPLALLGYHPNVVLVYYCNYLLHPRSGARIPAIVMEYIEGETLGQRLKRSIDLPAVLGIGSALCNAIIFIHSKGLMHGDLHEDNVMISSNGQVKVIDLMNDRRLSEITSGLRRLGETDDVESIKAIICGSLNAAGQSEALKQFEMGTRGIRNAVGVREALNQLSPNESASQSGDGMIAFLLHWGQVESVLKSLAGRVPEDRVISARALSEQVELPPMVKEEIHELTLLRNKAVHGSPVLIDNTAVMRALALVQTLRVIRRKESGAIF